MAKACAGLDQGAKTPAELCDGKCVFHLTCMVCTHEYADVLAEVRIMVE